MLLSQVKARLVHSTGLHLLRRRRRYSEGIFMDLSAASERLQKERARLQNLRSQAEVAGSEDTSQQDSLSELSSVDQHPADQATETFEREESLSLLEQLDAQIVDVDRALERIEAGEYGICEACGKAIGKERLEARPAARYCVEDQARLERELHPPAL
jgi:DnaK suppressor protein